jgi:hypothetical protein
MPQLKPPGHLKHCEDPVAPGISRNVPAGQRSEVADPASQKLPEGHKLHCPEAKRSVAEDQVPAGQGTDCELEDPAGQKNPGEQDPVGFEEASEQKRPAGQARQSETDFKPEAFENVPAGQAY